MQPGKLLILAGMSMVPSCVGGTSALAGEKHVIPEKPNILLVMTDDQGYGDLGCHGHPYLQTPNLDKLYAQSTRFTDFHVSPTCSPTRSALMSGRLPFKNGVTHTILERERMSLKSTTIAQVLKTVGYTTGIFGKWHLGDEDAYQPPSRGFDETFIHGGGGIGQDFPITVADAPPNRENQYYDPIIKHNGTFVKTKGYCTDVFFRQALGWIKQCSKEKKPFFAYLATNAPHGPYIVPDKYAEPYIGKCSPKSARFFGMIANIDENMGILMGKLDEWGLRDNTLLIFMTDNGTAAGTYNFGMKGKKGSVHEGGSRVPLFMRLPGLTKPGVDVARLTRHVDLFPTLAGIGGAKLQDNLDVDGRSLLPLIRNPNGDWSDRFTFFHGGRWGKEGFPGQWGRGDCNPDNWKRRNFAVRSERWRLVGPNQLYDIENDPNQTMNVMTKHPETAQKMLKAYDKWWDEVRPMLVNENEPIDKEKPFVVQYEKQKDAEGIPEWVPPKR